MFSELDGSNPNTFLQPNEFDYLSGFGMTIIGDTLYALGNSLTGQNNKSVLLLLQLSTGELIDSYSINDGGFHYLNDLAVSSKNEIFIKDSESNKMYKIKRPFKELDVYLDTEEIANSNGITISSNDKYLYLASAKGIRIVDIKTKRVVNETNKNFSGVDGLKLYGENLYGIVNAYSGDTLRNGLFKYNLTNGRSGILHRQKVVAFTEGFDIPTTFDILDGHRYFVINTQLDNFDGNTNMILEMKKLEPYKLMKIRTAD